MAIKVKIIKKGYGHSPGQELTLNEFEAGHLMAFGYAVPFIDGHETQAMKQPEIREIDHIHNPHEEKHIEIIPTERPVSFLKRRGRKPRA